MIELEHLCPADAIRIFIVQREGEVTEKTYQVYHYRLKPFVRWCDEENIDNLNGLMSRSLHEYCLWRKEGGDLKIISVKG